MSGPWMPTTAEVREMYASDEMGEYMDVAGQWFDRWLESELRAAKAEAWREGHEAGWHDGNRGHIDLAPNPYKPEEDRHVDQ